MASPTYEHMMDGGIYVDDYRTDFYLKENPNNMMDLVIVTRNGTFCLTECSPKDLARLGKWLEVTAKDFDKRPK